MKHDRPAPKPTAVLCTLTGTDRSVRGTAWNSALRRAATGVKACDGGYVITLRNEERLLGEIRDLVEAERKCCTWMNLELCLDEPVTLTVTAETNEGTAVIEAMLGPGLDRSFLDSKGSRRAR